ncbi:MAG: hypothetical protein GY807_12590 [Gammaproteobacteria bacterium]|nr:hypothetical protein [Gammaproteobacteria bacterium]
MTHRPSGDADEKTPRALLSTMCRQEFVGTKVLQVIDPDQPGQRLPDGADQARNKPGFR